jgi:leader peptidase (prepilin peptidase) / N-methyltransferase
MARVLSDALVFVLGLAVGSFLNVVRYRLPRRIGVARGRSKCPGCQGTIAWYDNVPVVSAVVLGFKCRRCGWKIPLIYPVIEVATGAAFLLVWLTFAPIEVPAYLVFVCLLVVCAGIDFDLRIIPDKLTLPGIALGVVASATLLRHGSTPSAILASALGIAVGGGSLLVIAWGYKLVRKVDGMGGGDIKLMAMVGAFLGWKLALLTIFLGSVAGGVAGAAMMRRSEDGLKTALPFGVFLSPAAFVCIMWGDLLLREYVRLLSARG